MRQRFKITSVMALTLSLFAFETAAQDELNVVSWDGAYVKSQILGFIRPYEDETGTRVNVIQYTGGIEEIRRQVRAWNVKWDVVDLELFDAIRACEEGLLEPIDPESLPAAPDGTPASEDFINVSLMPCGVGNVVGSTVVSYDRERFEKGPETLEDFFNLKQFPGRRGLRRSPQGNLEWALVADGVPRGNVYEVLSTEAGVDRAFTVLNRIKPYIEWWEEGEEAIRLLETGQVVMSSVYSGRVDDAVQRGEPLEIVWDHQVWFYDVWGIPRHGRNTEQAMDFLKYATSTESLAAQARYIPYGPVRQSSLALLEPELRKRLPTSEQNLKTAIELDAHWWSDNLDRIAPRFERWAERPVMVPKSLPR
ncbi:putative spermidine/putrescine transport system substrate-binding protein [Marinimicrobium koreense]|uniref:Putative spermidine/putrescine transport system substrate-binding protein n=2 Tax=Marinimicrobium TaxID=359337 RepID=A0A3N1NUJ1_9GAMM|nr:ABC transporter substrate-binding protein [Marinimicrobium koreense]ROQ18160.1 putative spermidine/putrescine transport system substrate-binding protein [Marinimicrobium koreense]